VFVLHAESVPALGGQTLRLLREARELVRRGHRCVVVGACGSAFEARARALSPPVEFVPFAFHRRAPHPLDVVAAWRLLRALRPEVVHTHSSADAWSFGIAARLCGLPIVRGRHIDKPLRPGLGSVVYTRCADAFTVSGETIGRGLVAGGVARPDQIYVTAGGFEPERFDPARREREFLRRELGLPAGTPLLGSVCNLRSMKGIEHLLTAFARVLAGALPDAHLVLAGSGSTAPFAQQLRGIESRVHVLGFRDDIERVLGGLDLFVLASTRGEGVPQVIPQAMALCVPVVATAVGGIPDAVVPAAPELAPPEAGAAARVVAAVPGAPHATGWLVPPGDPAALAQAIERAFALPPDALAALLEHARVRALERFTLAHVVDEYERAYRDVLAMR
jgi:glycosyltransferase involved in cell wall biosynthesis